jgi:hypothetical protein
VISGACRPSICSGGRDPSLRIPGADWLLGITVKGADPSTTYRRSGYNFASFGKPIQRFAGDQLRINQSRLDCFEEWGSHNARQTLLAGPRNVLAGGAFSRHECPPKA